MNLATTYLGLPLNNPLIVGSSPFCDHVDLARKLQDVGAAALVMRSLFEEQLTVVPRRATRSRRSVRPDFLAAFPDYADYQLSPAQYLRQLERLKKSLSVPVIASLNGYHPGHWTDFSLQLQSAGADAIELNFYQVVTNPTTDADEVETHMLETVTRITATVNVPVSVKISPFHSSIAQLAVALELAGASGIVIFNRFYQPDVDIEHLTIAPQLHLSDPGEQLLRLRWLAILSPLIRGSLGMTGGVHGATGVVKALLTGAHAVQVVSALLKKGPGVITRMRDGLESWMRRRGYEEVGDFRGLLNMWRCGDAGECERANYIRVLQSWKV